MATRLRDRADHGGSFVEYVALGMVAVLILGSLTAIGLRPRLRTAVSATICRIVQDDGACRTPAVRAEPVARAGTDDGREPAPEPEKDACHGFWGCAGHYGMTGLSAAGGVVAGFAEGAWGDVRAMYDLAKDPSTFVGGLKYALDHPGDAALSMVIDQATRDAWKRGDYANAVGRVLYNASSMALGAAGAAKVLIRLGRLARTAKAARAAKAAEAAKAAKAAKVAADAKKAAKAKVPVPPRWPGFAAWREGAVHFATSKASHPWLDANLGRSTKSLNMAERQAVFDYRTVSKANDVNESLRDERPATPEAARDIPHMDSAMEKVTLPDDLITSRLVGDDAFDRPLRRLTGSVQTNKGYTSVRVTEEPKIRAAPSANIAARGATPVDLHLRVPKGTKAAYPGNLWGTSYEPYDWHWDSEIILHRDLTYRIDHAEKAGGTWQVYGTVLP
ncbi:MAG TPA: ADP-ribosyltransferase [Streptosporangiaceae bacterium]